MRSSILHHYQKALLSCAAATTTTAWLYVVGHTGPEHSFICSPRRWPGPEDAGNAQCQMVNTRRRTPTSTNVLPVHDVPERLDVRGAVLVVLEVVRMLPHILQDTDSSNNQLAMRGALERTRVSNGIFFASLAGVPWLNDGPITSLAGD